MQLSGCTEKCKAGNSLKNGAKATGKARKRREGTEREADERKRTGRGENSSREARNGARGAESPKGKEANRATRSR